jgi:hypothetical protein
VPEKWRENEPRMKAGALTAGIQNVPAAFDANYVRIFSVFLKLLIFEAKKLEEKWDEKRGKFCR